MNFDDVNTSAACTSTVATVTTPAFDEIAGMNTPAFAMNVEITPVPTDDATLTGSAIAAGEPTPVVSTSTSPFTPMNAEDAFNLAMVNARRADKASVITPTNTSARRVVSVAYDLLANEGFAFAHRHATSGKELDPDFGRAPNLGVLADLSLCFWEGPDGDAPAHVQAGLVTLKRTEEHAVRVIYARSAAHARRTRSWLGGKAAILLRQGRRVKGPYTGIRIPVTGAAESQKLSDGDRNTTIRRYADGHAENTIRPVLADGIMLMLTPEYFAMVAKALGKGDAAAFQATYVNPTTRVHGKGLVVPGPRNLTAMVAEGAAYDLNPGWLWAFTHAPSREGKTSTHAYVHATMGAARHPAWGELREQLTAELVRHASVLGKVGRSVDLHAPVGRGALEFALRHGIAPATTQLDSVRKGARRYLASFAKHGARTEHRIGYLAGSLIVPRGICVVNGMKELSRRWLFAPPIITADTGLVPMVVIGTSEHVDEALRIVGIDDGVTRRALKRFVKSACRGMLHFNDTELADALRDSDGDRCALRFTWTGNTLPRTGREAWVNYLVEQSKTGKKRQVRDGFAWEDAGRMATKNVGIYDGPSTRCLILAEELRRRGMITIEVAFMLQDVAGVLKQVGSVTAIKHVTRLDVIATEITAAVGGFAPKLAEDLAAILGENDTLGALGILEAYMRTRLGLEERETIPDQALGATQKKMDGVRITEATEMIKKLRRGGRADVAVNAFLRALAVAHDTKVQVVSNRTMVAAIKVWVRERNIRPNHAEGIALSKAAALYHRACMEGRNDRTAWDDAYAFVSAHVPAEHIPFLVTWTGWGKQPIADEKARITFTFHAMELIGGEVAERFFAHIREKLEAAAEYTEVALFPERGWSEPPKGSAPRDMKDVPAPEYDHAHEDENEQEYAYEDDEVLEEF